MIRSRNFRHIIATILLGVTATLLLTRSIPAVAQASATANGPGSFVQVGGTGSLFQADYGRRLLGGEAVFVDAHLYRRIGVEAEARVLNIHEDQGVHETTYLVGPRFSFFPGRIRPYAKLLVGRGTFSFPYQFAKGSYFVVAPGAGVDWHAGSSRLTIRLIDIEFQRWPWFTFGPLEPFGVSSGVAVRIF